MDFLQFSPAQIKAFVLILIRVSAVLFLFPVFDSSVVPRTVKTGLALVITLSFLPTVTIPPQAFPDSSLRMLLLIVTELMIGLTLGLAVRLFFSAIQLGASLIGTQMGFAIVNVVDPQTGDQVSLMEQLAFWVAFSIFILLNGHYVLLLALRQSFEIVAMGRISLNDDLLARMCALSAGMFSLAVKSAAPAMVALFFTSAAFGLSAKFMPQMNILIVGFPVKIVVGLTFFAVCLEAISLFLKNYVDQLPWLLNSLLMSLGG